MTEGRREHGAREDHQLHQLQGRGREDHGAERRRLRPARARAAGWRSSRATRTRRSASWRANARARAPGTRLARSFRPATWRSSSGQRSPPRRPGYEFALVDTHGGGSELNSTVVASSTLAIVPTAITSYDVNASVTDRRVHRRPDRARGARGVGDRRAAGDEAPPHTQQVPRGRSAPRSRTSRSSRPCCATAMR